MEFSTDTDPDPALSAPGETESTTTVAAESLNSDVSEAVIDVHGHGATPVDDVDNNAGPPPTDRTSSVGDSPDVNTQPNVTGENSATVALTRALTELTAQIANFHDRAAAQETLIAKMHARIEKLQGGETKKLLKPISTQLVALYSDLEGAASELRPDTTIHQVAGLLMGFSLTVEQILDNLGLAPLQTAPGETFEPRLHHAIKRVDSAEPDSDLKIVEVLRQGFIEPGEPKPLVPSRVSVYRYNGSAPAATPTADSGEQ